MHCKYCNTAIPSTTGICPCCGRMASKEQMKYLKDFNRNKWDNTTNKNTSMYKSEKAHESNKKVGMFLVPVIILIVLLLALIKVIHG